MLVVKEKLAVIDIWQPLLSADKPIQNIQFPDLCPDPPHCAVTFSSLLMLYCMYIQLALHRVGGDWKILDEKSEQVVISPES